VNNVNESISKQSVIIHMFFRSEPPNYVSARERETKTLGNSDNSEMVLLTVTQCLGYNQCDEREGLL
jgi:hypothetical protein